MVGVIGLGHRRPGVRLESSGGERGPLGDGEGYAAGGTTRVLVGHFGMPRARCRRMRCVSWLPSFAGLVVVGLTTGRAEACVYFVGVVAAYPSGPVLPANDSIVLQLNLVDRSQIAVDATVDGESVTVGDTIILEGSSWWGTDSLVRVDFPDGLLVPGASVALSVAVSSASNPTFDVAYTVGSADNSDLVGRWGDVSLSMELQPISNESCSAPELYVLDATPTDTTSSSLQAERSRFVELVVYPEGEPGEAVVRSVSTAERTPVVASFAKGTEAEDLCARLSVSDASGTRETVLDVCDLCERFPGLCVSSDDGCACSADGRGSPWRAASMLLGFVGLLAARTRRLSLRGRARREGGVRSRTGHPQRP